MNRAFSRFYASLANRIIPEKVSQKKPFAPPNGPQSSKEEPVLDSSSPLRPVERKSGDEVWQRLLLIAAIFLLIAASRIVRLDYRELHPDEVWSVWQTFGTV